MKVILVSQDEGLYRLCREILRELAVGDCHLATASPEKCPADADSYIWDNQPNAEMVSRFRSNLSKHLFVVHRNDVAAFLQNLDGMEAHILLKPVTRSILSAFLSLAVSNSVDRSFKAASQRGDRDQILQCLIQANLKLQEYDQDRTNFLTRAVHDFRAPLTALNGYCGLLLSEALGSLTTDQCEVLRRMQHSAVRLSRMSSAMFQLSVGRHVKKQPNLRKGVIRECIEQALHEVGPLADNKGVALSVDLEEPQGLLYFEPGQIEQALVNLLDNACKFTPQGGDIEIHGYPFVWERRAVRSCPSPDQDRRSVASGTSNAYRIDIRNTGAPIPQKHLESAFEEYTSYAGGQDRSGGGLGLAICRMIANLHEGRVWAENTDGGPMFSFVLPSHSSEAKVSEASRIELLKFTEAS